MRNITVVGGGLGGLIAAISAAEAGANVVVYEAHSELGGRARSTARPYVANEGPHVVYDDGATWAWLARRGLVGEAARIGPGEAGCLRFRRDGRLRVLPPAGLLRAAAHRWLRAPSDVDFASWAGERFGIETMRHICGFVGVVTYDADPGRLSAEFVWDRFRRVARLGWPAARYVRGGWQTLVDNLARRARALGVRIEVGTRVTELPDPPVVIATSLAAARNLLADDTLHTESGRALLVDLGVRQRRGETFLLFDLDEGGFLERYSGPDPTLAPEWHALIQTQLPLRPGESKADGLRRLEPLLDLALPDWSARTTWWRESVATGRTGALDPPGTTWRDRPAIDRGDGYFLVGDQVAAPGLLSEVTTRSACRAAELAVAALRPSGKIGA